MPIRQKLEKTIKGKINELKTYTDETTQNKTQRKKVEEKKYPLKVSKMYLRNSEKRKQANIEETS